MTRRLLLFPILLSFSAMVIAQNVAPGRIQTSTRQVVLFSGLERQLNTAIAAKDRAKAAELLSDEFELRAPNRAGDPVPRDEWLNKVAAGEIPAGKRAGNMAARAFSSFGVLPSASASAATKQALNVAMETVIVDFLEQNANDEPGTRFVVDVWRGSQDKWLLAVRYVSDVPASKVQQPSSADKKPTGKQ
jgi:hypothetical protein